MARQKQNNKGFTLIEMALVLVIIGLIISAVSVGKDTMRSAEYHKAYNNYVQAWNQAAYGYFQRTGTVPEACQQASPFAGEENVVNTCVQIMQNVGLTLPAKYIMTNDAGELQSVAIVEIEDDRGLLQFTRNSANNVGAVGGAGGQAALVSAFNNATCTAAEVGAQPGAAAPAASADGEGGMVVCYSGPQAVAYMVDKIIDGNLADANTDRGTGPTAGDVRWHAVNSLDVNADGLINDAGGDQMVYFTVRLRDISGVGTGAQPVANN